MDAALAPLLEEKSVATVPRTNPPRARSPLLLIVPAVLLAGAAVTAYFIHAAGRETTDNAFIEGRVHPVSTRIAGTVSELLVADYQTVETGQPIARIDARDVEIALRESKAQLAQAEAGVPQAEAALGQARAQVRQAAAARTQSAAQVTKAELDFGRARSLFEGGAGGTRVISKSDFDSAQATVEIARAAMLAAEASQEAAQAALRAAEAGVGVAAARRDVAAVTVQNAELQVEYATIKAPVAGRLGKRNLEVGQRISPGQSLVALVGREVWVTANFKEGQLAKMHAGQRVRVTVDAVPDRELFGRVESLSPGTGAKFALLPPDNATGNFTKIVQRVPVRIALDAESTRGLEDRLRPGLSVTAEVLLK